MQMMNHYAKIRLVFEIYYLLLPSIANKIKLKKNTFFMEENGEDRFLIINLLDFWLHVTTCWIQIVDMASSSWAETWFSSFALTLRSFFFLSLKGWAIFLLLVFFLLIYYFHFFLPLCRRHIGLKIHSNEYKITRL